MNKKITSLFMVLCLAAATAGAQQITITSLLQDYQQQFNGLANTGATADTSTLPFGWYVNGGASYRVGNGSSSTGGVYSFGDSTNIDRALGTLGSGGAPNPMFGVKFLNNTGFSITDINMHFICEQWRQGQKPAVRNDTLYLSYNINADSLQATGWISYPAGNSITPDSSGAQGPRSGNVLPNREIHNHSISGLNIPDGANFWLRWSDLNTFGSDDALAIDSLTVTFEGGVLPPCVQPLSAVTNVELHSTGTTSVAGSFTGTIPPADGYLVLIDSSSVAPTVADGVAYSQGSTVGTAVVASNSASTTFSLTGLTQNTEYTAYVIPYNNVSCTGGPNYNTIDVQSDTAITAVDPCPEPAEPTNLQFTAVTKNSITGKFNKAVPAPAGYVVVFSTSSNVGYPVDSVTYNVNDSVVVGSFKSKVAFIGTDSNFTITGLDSSTRYHVAVVPYSLCGLFPNYNRSTPLRDDTVTAGVIPLLPCTAPSGVSNNTIVKLDSTATTITMKYAIPANADSVLVFAGPTSNIGFVTLRDSAFYGVGSTVPSDDTPPKVFARGTDTVVTLTGLTPNTVYKIFFVSFNNTNCTNVNYGGLANVTVRTAVAVGVKFKNSEATFSLYPNPAVNGTLNVKFSNLLKDDAVIEVIDVMGRKLSAQKVMANSDFQTINVSKLAKGTYILNVLYKGTDNVSTFMIE